MCSLRHSYNASSRAPTSLQLSPSLITCVYVLLNCMMLHAVLQMLRRPPFLYGLNGCFFRWQLCDAYRRIILHIGGHLNVAANLSVNFWSLTFVRGSWAASREQTCSCSF